MSTLNEGSESMAKHVKRRLETDTEARMRVGPVCDFCGDRPCPWKFAVSDFSETYTAPDTSKLKINNIGGWSACTQCMLLVETRELLPLAERAMKQIPDYMRVKNGHFQSEALFELAKGLLTTYKELFARLDAESVHAQPFLLDESTTPFGSDFQKP